MSIVKYWSRRPGKFLNSQTGKAIVPAQSDDIFATVAAEFHGSISDWYNTLHEVIYQAIKECELKEFTPVRLVVPEGKGKIADILRFSDLSQYSKPDVRDSFKLVGLLAGRYPPLEIYEDSFTKGRTISVETPHEQIAKIIIEDVEG